MAARLQAYNGKRKGLVQMVQMKGGAGECVGGGVGIERTFKKDQLHWERVCTCGSVHEGCTQDEEFDVRSRSAKKEGGQIFARGGSVSSSANGEIIALLHLPLNHRPGQSERGAFGSRHCPSAPATELRM